MVRFIFLCMAVVAIAVAAIPGMQMMNGIVKEHEKSMVLASQQAPVDADTTTAESLNAISTAAGDVDYGTEELPQTFNNIEPAGFGDPVADTE